MLESKSNSLIEGKALYGGNKKALDLLLKIAKFLIERAKNPYFESAEFENYYMEK